MPGSIAQIIMNVLIMSKIMIIMKKDTLLLTGPTAQIIGWDSLV